MGLTNMDFDTNDASLSVDHAADYYRVAFHYDFDLDQVWDIGLHRTILKTCTKIPEKVLLFVEKNISFVLGCTCASRKRDFVGWGQGRRLLIVISDKDKDSETVEDFIAHEIAHCYLKHPDFPYSKLTKEIADEQERQANRLIIKWGFSPANSFV
jgi:hypothetical protein